MSHRLWWLICSVALIIGAMIGFDLQVPAQTGSATLPPSVAMQKPEARRG